MKNLKSRRLSSEDKELWDKVRHSAVPLHQQNKAAIVEAVREISKPKTPKTLNIPSFRIGQAAGFEPAVLSNGYATTPLRMDNKSFTKLKRGKLSPEATFDLHGMTLDQAHPALVGFVMRAHSQGKRLVLVITGKGKNKDDLGPVPVRKGVLKHHVPNWLATGPMRSVVLQVSDAHIRHGGTGAYYVFLRRQR